MKRNISPVVAIIVILIVIAAVAFVWLRATKEPVARVPEPERSGPPAGRERREGGPQRGSRGLERPPGASGEEPGSLPQESPAAGP